MRVVVGQQGRKLGVLVLTFGALVWLLGQVCCLKFSRVYILTKHKMKCKEINIDPRKTYMTQRNSQSFLSDNLTRVFKK